MPIRSDWIENSKDPEDLSSPENWEGNPNWEENLKAAEDTVWHIANHAAAHYLGEKAVEGAELAGLVGEVAGLGPVVGLSLGLADDVDGKTQDPYWGEPPDVPDPSAVNGGELNANNNWESFGDLPLDEHDVHSLPEAPPTYVGDVHDLPDVPVDVHDLPDVPVDVHSLPDAPPTDVHDLPDAPRPPDAPQGDAHNRPEPQN